MIHRLGRILVLLTILTMSTGLLQAQEPGSIFSHLSDVLWVASPDESNKIEVPGHVWAKVAESGAIELKFRPTREIRANMDPPLIMTLIKSPLITLELEEEPRHSWFQLHVSGGKDGSTSSNSSRMFSHLKPQWYHLIVTWDALNGHTEIYLNGVLQVNPRDQEPWVPPLNSQGPVQLGGLFGDNDSRTGIEVSEVFIRNGLVDDETAWALAEVAGLTRLDGEGRTIYEEALNLSGLNLELVYEADFNQPLRMIHEDDLFEGDERIHEPDNDIDWVLEGPGTAKTENGRLHVENVSYHVVLWNTRTFPENFLLDFTMKPVNPDKGLTIIFFCAQPVKGESIFSAGLPKRAGEFSSYTREGIINSYHTSYMATNRSDGEGNVRKRRTSNLRKNDGFYMIAVGDDRVAGYKDGFNRVRLLKQDNRVRVEVNGKIVIAFDDDPDLYGLPVWGEGLIGLRQMEYTDSAEYEFFKVYEIH